MGRRMRPLITTCHCSKRRVLEASPERPMFVRHVAICGGELLRTPCLRTSQNPPSRQLGEYLAWHRGSGQLFQPVGDLIVVGLVCDEHVADGPEAGRLVQAAGTDRNARCVNAPPEQTRPASNAEATPRPLRGPVPLQSAIF